MRTLGVQPQAWAPFAEGLHGMFGRAGARGDCAQAWQNAGADHFALDVEQGVIVIPKSVHKNRMEENLAIWDFALDADDASQITALE